MNYGLKFEIIKSGRNQIEIAREAKIQESKLSKIINGYIDPTPTEQERIAKALNKPVYALFPEEEKV